MNHVGSNGGALVRVHVSHQCGLGYNPSIDAIMWNEFVVGSLPCSERFLLRVLRFSPLLKNQHLQIPIQVGI